MQSHEIHLKESSPACVLRLCVYVVFFFIFVFFRLPSFIKILLCFRKNNGSAVNSILVFASEVRNSDYFYFQCFESS